ncbi:MAG TPA: hypothetical protein VJI46_00325 [Candidatus Nanoarchaeia archaeon]|nr:hypothetical protein [Candidatus Nanoarchaeia archaeon]
MEKNDSIMYILIGIFAVLILFNQLQISAIAAAANGGSTSFTAFSFSGGDDVSDVDISQIQNTMQSYAALFPVDKIKTPEDAVAILIPTGTPEYGASMGVSFDDPIGSLAKLANAQPALLAGLTPEQKTRFLNLALKPVGLSCEYCCGVGPVGIRKDGSSACGCQHNPAILSVTMWLMQNTDYSDAQILKEALRWKALFFPQKVVGEVVKIAGGDASALNQLPGMVGGC